MNLMTQLFLLFFAFTHFFNETVGYVELNIGQGEYWWGGFKLKGT
jgi:hypothetical protein